ncbi:MAG: endonuclease III domain-containing protein [Candidatus Omnitrophica bacterium]|nr:endonuclease III domain-containing protein [Candidatus Omnitrophota bacterium]
MSLLPPPVNFRKKYIIRAMYLRLFEAYGPQRWWPAQTPFEVIVGAILVQNTNWQNVEKAIKNLSDKKLLVFSSLNALTAVQISSYIRPAGYYNIKAKRLKNFLTFLAQHYDGNVACMAARPLKDLRNELLSVNGIGPETADSILLYALNKPVFVVDAYTRRLLVRHGFEKDTGSYQAMQELFMSSLEPDTAMFNEYHALIVRLGKDFRKEKAAGPDYPLKDKKYFL